MSGINWGNNPITNNNPYNLISQNNFMQQMSPFAAPHYEVIRVQGEPGVDMFQMGPNSSVLLLDETAPIVWFVQTDGAGYKTKTPYDVSLHIDEPKPDVKTLEDRLVSIDERLQKIEGAMNDESDS